MNLNIGCGKKKSRGQYKSAQWVNVDLVGGDVRASALALPFRAGTFSVIHAIHVLEHIPRPYHAQFHQEMYRALRSGGLYYVEVPNFAEICRILTAYTQQDLRDPEMKEEIRCWTLSIYGKHRHVGDAHHWGFFPFSLCDDLRDAGFIDRTWLKEREDMISGHYRQEPVILFRGRK